MESTLAAFDTKTGMLKLQQQMLGCLATLAVPLVATAVATGTADAAGTGALAATAGLRLYGYSARESAGSAAVASFNVRNGASVAGPIVAVEELAANAAVTRYFPDGIPCDDGVFMDRVTGETEIVFYTKVIA